MRLIALIALAACSSNAPAQLQKPPASAETTAVPEPARSPATDGFELRGELEQVRSVDRQLATIELAWIAEASRGTRRAALLWPALKDGRVIDNDVIAIVFIKEAGAWKIAGQEIGPKPEKTAIEAALGGSFALTKPDGLPIAELAAHILGTARRFQNALAAGESAEAIAAFEDFARAFGPKMLIYDNTAVDLIIGGRLAQLDELELQDVKTSGETATGTLVSKRAGESSSLPVLLLRAGEGWAIDAFVP